MITTIIWVINYLLIWTKLGLPPLTVPMGKQKDLHVPSLIAPRLIQEEQDWGFILRSLITTKSPEFCVLTAQWNFAKMGI